MFICIEGFADADAGGAHVRQPYVKKFFEAAPDLVATQPQIIYIDTPHEGFGPMGEIQPRLAAARAPAADQVPSARHDDGSGVDAFLG